MPCNSNVLLVAVTMNTKNMARQKAKLNWRTTLL